MKYKIEQLRKQADECTAKADALEAQLPKLITSFEHGDVFETERGQILIPIQAEYICYGDKCDKWLLLGLDNKIAIYSNDPYTTEQTLHGINNFSGPARLVGRLGIIRNS